MLSKNMIKKNVKTKKNEKSFRDYQKIRNFIDHSNLNFKIDSEEKLIFLLKSINQFVIQRMEALQSDECLTYFLQNMKRYKILLCIMDNYSNSGTTYKEEIVKKLRIYSYKTISNILDDCLERGYIKYTNTSFSNNSKRKIKKFRPTSILITNYINWILQHVGNLNKTLKNIK